MATALTVLAYLLVASLLVAAILAMRSARLEQRFVKMGTLKGRSLDEIVRIAGKPSHRGRIDARRELLEWRRIRFHLALTFTDGVCDGVAYQSDRGA